MTHWISIAFAGLVLGTGMPESTQVGLIEIDGAIGPATASYIARAIGAAAAQHDQCLIIQLDTPGGLLESTKQIVQTFYASKVPVVVYVSPSGASAGSAGVFITLAADIAAMAPNTIIGAAHPITLGTGGGAGRSQAGAGAPLLRLSQPEGLSDRSTLLAYCLEACEIQGHHG